MGWRSRYFWIARVDVGKNCGDSAVYEVGSQAIEVFTSGICIPIKAGYCIAVVPYTLMKGCPVSARMSNAGDPFLLKGFGVLGHILFIDRLLFAYESI
jgi:hypothetical protein